jgi:hypothetical protein
MHRVRVQLGVVDRLHLILYRKMVEAILRFGNVVDSWPVEMVGNQRDAVGCKHNGEVAASRG